MNRRILAAILIAATVASQFAFAGARPQKRVWVIGDSNTDNYATSAAGMWDFQPDYSYRNVPMGYAGSGTTDGNADPNKQGIYYLLQMMDPDYAIRMVGTEMDSVIDPDDPRWKMKRAHDGIPGSSLSQWAYASPYYPESKSLVQEKLDEMWAVNDDLYPEIIVVMLGTNDLMYSYTNEDTVLVIDMVALMQEIKAWYDEKELEFYPQIIIMNPPACGNEFEFGPDGERVGRLNKNLQSFAKFLGSPVATTMLNSVGLSYKRVDVFGTMGKMFNKKGKAFGFYPWERLGFPAPVHFQSLLHRDGVANAFAKSVVLKQSYKNSVAATDNYSWKGMDGLFISYPDEYSNVFTGQIVPVVFSCYPPDDIVNIQYSAGGSDTWQTIASVPGSAARVDWEIGGIIEDGSYAIRVKSQRHPKLCDTVNVLIAYDAGFDSLAVIWPDQSDPLAYQLPGPYYVDRAYINFECFAVGALVDVSYSSDNGATWNFIETITGADGMYAWNYFSMPDGTYRLKLSLNHNPEVSVEVGDYVVALEGLPKLKIMYPTAELPPEDRVFPGPNLWTTIPLQFACLFSGMVDIAYSSDAGATWNTIGSVEASWGGFSWEFAGMPAGTYILRATSQDDPTIFDQTADLTISWDNIPPLVITWPNSFTSPDELRYPGPYYNSAVFIQFSCFVPGAVLDISYSSDNGATWTYIESVPGTYGYYDWDYTNVPVGTYKIRIAVQNDPTISDEFGDFVIEGPPVPYPYPETVQAIGTGN